MHESGHFLVAYLSGLLPRGYTLSAFDALLRARALNVQAGCSFCDGAFRAEVSSGKVQSGSIDQFTMVALAGVVSEFLRFGVAEGGLGDIRQLDALLRAVGFSQRKADDEVRWAVISVADMLRRHRGVQGRLAEAMRRGESVGACIGVLEAAFAQSDDV